MLAARGVLPAQAAAMDSRDLHSVQTVLHRSLVRLLAWSPGALRDSPWLELIMPVLVSNFQVHTQSAWGEMRLWRTQRSPWLRRHCHHGPIPAAAWHPQ